MRSSSGSVRTTNTTASDECGRLRRRAHRWCAGLLGCEWAFASGPPGTRTRNLRIKSPIGTSRSKDRKPHDKRVCFSALPIVSQRFPVHHGTETGRDLRLALPWKLAIRSIPDRRGGRNTIRTPRSSGNALPGLPKRASRPSLVEHLSFPRLRVAPALVWWYDHAASRRRSVRAQRPPPGRMAPSEGRKPWSARAVLFGAPTTDRQALGHAPGGGGLF